MAAGGVGLPPRGPLAGSVAGFLSAVPTVLALPPWPALPVPFRASSCFRYRPFFGGRRAPPCQCFRSVSVAPGRGCRRYRLCLPVRTRPPYQCVGVPRSDGGLIGFIVRRAPSLFVCRRVCRHRGVVDGSVGGSVATGESSMGLSAGLLPPGSRRWVCRRVCRHLGAVGGSVRSGFGGRRRPSRIPIAVRSKFARRSGSQ